MAGKKRPKVGIAVLVLRDGKVLLGKRKGAHGSGEYASPGGHMEYWESYAECAKRECREEAGIKIKNIRFLRLSNLKRYGRKHYVDIGLVAEWASGEPKVLEPQRMIEWGWYDLDRLPAPLFAELEHSFEALKTGKNFFDS